MKLQNLDWKFWLKAILFCLVVYFPLFLHLDSFPLRLFDESRLALNAAEMMKHGNWLVPHYQGAPDMWNTKPPLLIWMQTILFKTMGPSELALRLPPAIAAVFTCLLLVLFTARHFKSYWFGLISVLVLLTSVGYVEKHGTRTGDYDSVLVLFITAYSLSAFLFVETRKQKYLKLFFLFVTLGVLTKSVQALIIVPIIFLYCTVFLWSTISKKELITNIKAVLISAAVIATYYLGRELINPGYLQAVWDNELGGRYTEALEEHSAEFSFYFDMMVNHDFPDWYWFSLGGFVIGLFSKNKSLRRLSFFFGLIVLWYWYIISSAETKLQWYELPLFPFLSVLAGIGIYTVFEAINTFKPLTKQLTYNVLPVIFLAWFFYEPYDRMFDKVHESKEYPWDEQRYAMSHYMQQASKKRVDMEGSKVCYDGYNASLEFYEFLLIERGIDTELIRTDEIQVGDTVLAYEPIVKEFLQANFNARATVVDGEHVTQYIIDSKR